MSGYRVDGPILVRIEQAIARGETPDWMVTHLGVDYPMIDRALRRLDLANAEPDELSARRPLAPHGTHAAFVLHRKRRDEPCEACRQGERRYDAEKHRQQRARRQGRAA